MSPARSVMRSLTRPAATLAMTAVFGLASVACSSGTGSAASGPAHPVVAAPPPKDDGQPSKGGSGGNLHSAALEQLQIGKIGRRLDNQSSVLIPLPDAEHWTRVKFWGVESLVGFRYGKDHHALVGAFVMHVDDNTAPGACIKSFDEWAMPMVEAFDVEVHHEPPIAVMWHRQVVDVDSVFAQTATALMREAYAGTYAAYPAWWKNACMIVGVAVPSRDDDERARGGSGPVCARGAPARGGAQQRRAAAAVLRRAYEQAGRVGDGSFVGERRGGGGGFLTRGYRVFGTSRGGAGGRGDRDAATRRL